MRKNVEKVFRQMPVLRRNAGFSAHELNCANLCFEKCREFNGGGQILVFWHLIQKFFGFFNATWFLSGLTMKTNNGAYLPEKYTNLIALFNWLPLLPFEFAHANLFGVGSGEPMGRVAMPVFWALYYTILLAIDY